MMQKKGWAQNVTPGKQGFQPTNKGATPPLAGSAPDGPTEPNESSVSAIDDAHQLYLRATSASDSQSIDEHDITESLNWPQANDVWKIGGVVTAVDQGVSTAKAIAHTLGPNGVEDRQGAYYAAAAESLGLLEREPSSRPTQWQLTELGHQYIQCADSREKADILATLVEAHPAVQLRNTEGDEALKEAMHRAALSDDTAQRRTACIKSWSDWSRSEGRDSQMHDFSVFAAGRVAAAMEIKAEQLRAKPQPRPVCSECFLEIPTSEGPASDVCFDCGG